MVEMLNEPVELTGDELDVVAGGAQVAIGNVALQAVFRNDFDQLAVGSGAENEITIANNAGNIANSFNG